MSARTKGCGPAGACRCAASWPAFGPLRSFVSDCHRGRRRGSKGASGQAGALQWSGLRFAPASLRCSRPRPRRRTHCVRCAHSVQTTATSQMTIRASRGVASAALLGAPQAHSSLPERTFADALVVCAASSVGAAARQAVPGGGDLCGGEERRPSVGARSALRELTRRSCPSVVSAANAASSATRLKAEHRSEVGAKRRPPQHEPPAGTACRAPRQPTARRRPRTAATGRRQKPRLVEREGVSLQRGPAA